jgi:hypothetical protein
MTRDARPSEAFVSTLTRRLGIAVVFGAIALGAIPASAQELSLGYQWQQLSFDIEDEFDEFLDDSLTAPLGFNIDVAGPITPSLDIFGQFDWSRKSDDFDVFGVSLESRLNFMTFGAGLRWSSRANPSVTPFVQGLFGATRSSLDCEVTGFDCDDELEQLVGDELNATNPMMQIGGGVAIPMGGVSALGQLDYRRIFAGDDVGVNGFRFVLGVRLGGR